MRERSFCCRCRWFVNDGVGIGCAVFTYILIAYGEFVVVFVMLLPDLSSFGWASFHAVLFTCLSLLALVSHIRSMVTDPGTIPLGNCTADNVKKLKLREGDVLLRCTRCECIKLDRAHHCSTCQRCIRKMDHHCPWINNCVGEDNQKFFILFTFYIMIISLYSLVLAVRQLYICTEKDWHAMPQPAPQLTAMQCVCLYTVSREGFSLPAGADCTFMPLASSILLMIFLVFEGLLFGIFTLVMLCSQVTSVVRDETGIEYLKKEKRFKQSTVYGNLQEVFGGNLSLKWLSPFSNTTNRRSSYYFHEV